MILPIQFSRPVAMFAVQKLALIDYDVATKVSDLVADVSVWGYQHNMPYIAEYAIDGLQKLDQFGSLLIAVVAYIINHTI